MFTLLAILVPITKSEQGCLEDGFFQSVDDPTAFTTFEVWADPESEAAHWEPPHLKDILSQLPELMEGDAEVSKYEKVV